MQTKAPKTKEQIINDLRAITTPVSRWNKETKDFEEVLVNPTVFEMKGAICAISAEDGYGFADYYGEFRGGFPYINKDIEKYADKNGLFIEWVDPGSIAFYN